jgi:hypothetical protein
MEYTLINTDLTCGGIVGIEPNHNNWTLIPYLGGLVKEKWNGTEWVEGASEVEIVEATKPIIPQEVQLWRVRTILKLSGLESNIETALNGLDEPMKTGALYVWNYGTTIERQSATVQLLQYVLGLTDTQVDDIFIQANAIQI